MKEQATATAVEDRVIRIVSKTTHFAKWEAKEGGFYELRCQVCGHTFGQSYIPDLKSGVIELEGKCER